MPANRLVTASVLYLFIPVWLFLLFWVRLPIALPILLLTTVAVWRFCLERGAIPPTSVSAVPLRRHEYVVLLLASLFFLGISGIGGFTGQHSDYDKHNQLFADLIAYPWPVRYTNARYDNPFLCYYLAYYLPTAGLVKLTHLPLRWADLLSAVWGWAGLMLSLSWAVRLSGPYRVWIGAALLLIAGIEIPYRLGPWLWVESGGNWSDWWDALRNGNILRYSAYVPPRYFFSGREWQHSLTAVPLIDQLQQTPQHAYPGWLGLSLFLYRQRSGLNVLGMVLIGSALLLWSPFAALGLALFVLVCNWQRLPNDLRQPKQLLRYVPAALGLTGVLSLYFMAHAPLEFRGLILEGWQRPSDGLLHLGYVALNYGLPVGLLYLACRGLPTARSWITLAAMSALLIALCSLVYVGVYNDFFSRTIIPAQWAFHLSLANGLAIALTARPLWRAGTLLLGSWVLAGLFMPARLVAYTIWALNFPQALPSSIQYAASHRASIIRLSAVAASDPVADYAAQYIGSRHSRFYRRVMKE